MLKKLVLDEIKNTKAKVSVVLKDLTQDKNILNIEDDRVFPSASIIKILIMIEAFNQVEKGKYKLNQIIDVKDKDKVPYSIITELKINRFTFEDVVTLMMITSDNTATNIMIDLLGFENINKTIISLGLNDTKLQRKMMDFQAAKEGRQNIISAKDMLLVMEKIYSKSILNDELSDLMLDILKRQTSKDLLARYLEEEVIIGHKTGGLEKLKHDIGIFYLDNIEYILGVFVTDAETDLEARQIVGKISKCVYDYYILN